MRKIAFETLIWSAAISATALAAPATKTTAKAMPKSGVKPATSAKPTAKPTIKPTDSKPVAPKIAASAQEAEPLYQNDLQKFAPGKLPDEFLVLGGEFSLVKDGDNVLIELPSDPIDAFGLLYGPTIKSEGAVASARFFGTKKGRRMPSFGVGVFGISGYKVRLSPAAGKLEILKDEMVKADVPFEWKSDTWTRLKVQARPVDKGQWKVEARAWPDGEKEPETWQLEWTDSEAPPSGRASLIGAPYSGLPIRFDDLMADKIKP